MTFGGRTAGRTATRAVVLAVTVGAAAVFAVLLHRNGHTQGDDFALYLRQAQSIFDGDTRDVIADNRFSVQNSGGSFSPEVYPWGLPLLLAPFVEQWGLDYDRLKLVEVAAFCVWLVVVHGVVRRRVGRPIAWATMAVIGTSTTLLAHTDSLLSEFPHALAVAIVIWWLDRVLARGPLASASTRDLVVLGVVMMAAYNMRRESIVLFVAVGVVQLAETARLRSVRASLRATPLPSLARLATPHVTFAVSVVAFQLLLPSMLFPDNADSGPQHILDRLQEFPAVLTNMVGLDHTALGVVILALALVGVVAGLVRRTWLDLPLVVVTVLSLLAVSTHFRPTGPRYYFQVLPWTVYFAAAGVIAMAQLAMGPFTSSAAGDAEPGEGRARARGVAQGAAVLGLLLVVTAHSRSLSDRIDAARAFDDSGAKQIGPAHPDYIPVYDAVAEHTPDDAVITFFRARTMTLLTDRRAIQTMRIERAEEHSDYWAQQVDSDYSQPELSEFEAFGRGYQIVWRDDRWILWDLHPDGCSES